MYTYIEFIYVDILVVEEILHQLVVNIPLFTGFQSSFWCLPSLNSCNFRAPRLFEIKKQCWMV